MATNVQDAPRLGSGGALAGLGSVFLVVLRIGAGLMFMQHGAQKLFGWLGGHGPVELISLMGLAGVLEFFGGLIVALGLFTRPVALLLALQMVAAHFMAHQPQGGFPIENQGELALIYAMIFGFFAANGAGPASLDAYRESR